MNYEVVHGTRTEFVQAGNQWAACLDLLRIEAEEDEVHAGPFRVTAMPMGEPETIHMATLLNLRLVANGEPLQPPKIDLAHW